MASASSDETTMEKDIDKRNNDFLQFIQFTYNEPNTQFQQNDVTKLVAFFNMHLGIALDSCYWTTVCSTMTILSILHLADLISTNSEAARQIQADNLSHPFSYVYAKTTWMDDDGRRFGILKMRKQHEKLEPLYTKMVNAYKTQDIFQDIEFPTWRTISRRASIYMRVMGKYTSINWIMQYEHPDSIHRRISKHFKRNKGTSKSFENQTFYNIMCASFKEDATTMISQQQHYQQDSDVNNNGTVASRMCTRSSRPNGHPSRKLLGSGSCFGKRWKQTEDSPKSFAESSEESSEDEDHDDEEYIDYQVKRPRLEHQLQIVQQECQALKAKLKQKPRQQPRQHRTKKCGQTHKQKSIIKSIQLPQATTLNTQLLEEPPLQASSYLQFSSDTQAFKQVPNNIFHANNTEGCPYMGIAMFTNKHGEMVSGPEMETFELQPPDLPPGIRLHKLIFFPTSPAYFSMFTSPDLCPHSVVPYQEMTRLVTKWVSTYPQPCGLFVQGINQTGKPMNHLTNSHNEFITLTCSDPQWSSSAFPTMKFDTSYWVHRFTEDITAKDSLRQVKTINLGFSGGSAHEHAAFTQANDPSATVAKPAMINQSDSDYEQMGPVLQALHDSALEYGRTEKGTPILQDQNLEEHFCKPFRARCDTDNNHSTYTFNWHAATVAWQKAGDLVDMDGNPISIEDLDKVPVKIKWNFESMKIHKDGKNMGRDGFKYTAIFSVMVIVGTEVYRLTFIAYTRQICDLWLHKHLGYVKEIGSRVEKYFHEENAGIQFEDFKLTPTMDHYKIMVENGSNGSNSNTKLLSMSQAQNVEAQDIQWKQVSLEHDSHPSVEYFNLKEFICRSGYDSGKAWIANSLSLQKKLRRRNRLELLWAALLSPSAITYATVLSFWLQGNMVPNHEFAFNDDSVNLLREYERTTDYLGFESPTAGQCPRWMCGNVWPTRGSKKCKVLTPEGYLQHLAILEKGIEDLKSGQLYLRNIMGPEKLYGCGPVSLLSFPSLCIFMEFVEPTDDNAITRAITAKIEEKKTNALWNQLENSGNYNKPTPTQWRGISNSLGDKYGNGRQADFENYLCIDIRGLKRGDVFFKGQDLYCIIRRTPMIKRWNTDTWLPLKEVRDAERLAAGCAFLSPYSLVI